MLEQSNPKILSQPFSASDPDSLRVKGEIVFEKVQHVRAVYVWFVAEETGKWTLIGVKYNDKELHDDVLSMKNLKKFMRDVSRHGDRAHVSLEGVIP